MTTEATLYIGTPEALQAEIGLLPCYKGPFVVAGFNAAGLELTPESDIADKDEAHAIAEDIAAWLRSEGETVSVLWL